jgi:hypothetical protein
MASGWWEGGFREGSDLLVFNLALLLPGTGYAGAMGGSICVMACGKRLGAGASIGIIG